MFQPFDEQGATPEENLERARAFLRAIFELTPTGMLLKTTDSRFIAASRIVADVMGAQDPSDLIGRSDHDFYPKERADHYRAQEQAIVETKIPLERALQPKMVGGRLRQWLVTKFPVLDSEGRVIGLVGFSEEDRDAGTSSEVLRESEERFSTIFRHAPLAMAIFRVADGKVVEANDRFLEQFQYRRSEIVGRTATDLGLHANAFEQIRVRELLRNREPVQSLEVEVTTHSGSNGHILLSIAEITLNAEPHYLAMVVDITERKVREERIQEQAQLLDIASDAIIVSDMRNRIRYWNRSAQQLFGWQAEEALGGDGHSLLHGKHPDETAEAMRIVLERGSWSGDIHYDTKDGREILGEARWTLARNQQGEPSAILSVITDATERRNLQAQLLRAQRLESLGTLAGGIAHDLNNVLTPILMGMESLGSWVTSPEGIEVLLAMRKSAERGAEVVKQILDFARGAPGEREQVDVNALLSEVSKIAGETFPKSIEIAVKSLDRPCVITANATQIHQVAMNLAVNARDAMPNGGRMSLGARIVHLDEAGARVHLGARPIEYVLMTVEDNGVGIPAAILDNIFDPFFTTKEPGKGTGLGLPTALTIVKAHGGFIAVHSEEGKGTTFEVYLPTCPREADSSAPSAGPGATRSGSGELLLLVDDEEAILRTTRWALEHAGYRVVTALSGAQALELYREHREEIHAVITDMMMPHMDGAELARHLRRIDPAVTVIAMSGLELSQPDPAIGDSPIQGFIAKPFTGESLLATLHAVLNRGE